MKNTFLLKEVPYFYGKCEKIGLCFLNNISWHSTVQRQFLLYIVNLNFENSLRYLQLFRGTETQ